MKTIVLLLSLLLTACTAGPGSLDDDDAGSTAATEGGDGDGDGDGTSYPDAGLPASCDESPPLELGRCMQAGTDLECTGQTDEDLEFIGLNDGDSMQLVLGPQGAQMLLFLARGSGFDPGDPEDVGSTDNPLIEMWLHDVDADEEIARYRGYVAFTEGDGGSLVTAGGLFAITEHSPAQLADHRIDVEAALRDRDGALRCGRVQIAIGG